MYQYQLYFDHDHPVKRVQKRMSFSTEGQLMQRINKRLSLNPDVLRRMKYMKADVDISPVCNQMKNVVIGYRLRDRLRRGCVKISFRDWYYSGLSLYLELARDQGICSK